MNILILDHIQKSRIQILALRQFILTDSTSICSDPALKFSKVPPIRPQVFLSNLFSINFSPIVPLDATYSQLLVASLNNQTNFIKKFYNTPYCCSVHQQTICDGT